MDLKSFYKKIDVDSIKNKLPPIKLPKLKSRKIFKSSREDLAHQQQSPSKALGGINSPLSPQSLPGHSPFIDRTPTRISTVSSLMNINYGFKDKRRDSNTAQQQSTYKTASHFEEENCPDEFDTREPVSGNSVGRFSDRCKKTYKDFSDFKIKHIFTKKTVVKRTEIEVDIYARQYEQDNYLEERYLDNQLEETGYKFEFKEARRRLSVSSRSISPPDSLASGVPSPIRSELGHLQQNNTPPLLAKRRNAITQAELMRQKCQHRSMSSESNDEPPRKPIRSSLWGLHEENSQSELEQTDGRKVHRTIDSRLSKFKKSVKENFRDSISAESGDDQQRTGISSRVAKFRKQMKRGASDEKDPPAESRQEQADPQKPLTSRMARIKKSMKEGLPEGFLERHHPAESGDDHEHPTTSSKPEHSRLARFKRTMKDGITEGFSDKNIPAESGDEQPSVTRPGPSRMARFKQSMKAGLSEGILDRQIPTESGDEPTASNKPGPSRMARFKMSMQAGMSEATSEKHIPTEDGDEPAQPQKGISRMARFKRSVKEGISTESGDDQQKPTESRISKFKKSMKEGMSHEFDSTWNLKGIRNRFAPEETGAESKSKKNAQSQESLDEHSDVEKKPWKLKNIHLRRGEPSEKTNDPAASSPEGKFSSIKMSINRLKSRKPQRQTSEESDAEAPPEESPKQNMSNQLKAGLRRLKMRERSMTFDEDDAKTPKEPPAISRLQNWKKSIKIKRSNEPSADESGAEPPPLPASSPPGRSRTLLRKLNHIRSRKEVSEDEAESGDPSQANDQQKLKSKNLEKLEQARAKALQKVNAQVRKMRNFHGKSKDSLSDGSPEKPGRKKKPEQGEKGNAEKSLSTVLSSHSLESQLSLDDNEETSRPSPEKTALCRTYKFEHGTKPKHTKRAPLAGFGSKDSSLSLEDDDYSKGPVASRVDIHQDNSDNYETTLTISVTRPAPAIPSLTVLKTTMPKTIYQPPKTDWIPNKNAVSSFLEMTPSPHSSTQQLDINNRTSHGHMRKRSMDSNDSDSWIPENFRNKSCSSSTSTGLNKIAENTEPWKVSSGLGEEKLYKTRSIDIFANPDHVGAFKDFDDELKNVPVRRIIAASAESLNKSYTGSTDDDDDYDNSSRITKIKQESPMTSTKVAVEPIRNASSFDSTTDSNKAPGGIIVPRKPTAQIGNSQESLDANYDENEEMSSGDDDDDDEEDDVDEVPDIAPSPPPSFSPPPPPLPLRKPPRMIPERNDSMVRLAHPLVKQGSLRRLYIEEIEPSDLGKVNKLINRFEKTPSNENLPRIQLIPSDDNYNYDDILKIVEPIPIAKPKENGAKKRPPVPHPPDVVSDANDNFKREEINDTTGNKKCQSRNGTSDEEEVIETKKMTRSSSKRRPAPIPKQSVTSIIQDNNHNNKIDNKADLRTIQEQRRAPSPECQENLDNISIQSPNSIYGSPIGSICLSERISTSSVYGSPIGAAYSVRNSADPMRSDRRLSIRSSIRDDDTFYSFESDEENNFYSLGDSSDIRYIVEI